MAGDEDGHETELRKQDEETAGTAAAVEQTASHGSSCASSPVRFSIPIKCARTRLAMAPRPISEQYTQRMKKVGVGLEIAVSNLAEGLSNRWPVDCITFLPTGRVSVH